MKKAALSLILSGFLLLTLSACSQQDTADINDVNDINDIKNSDTLNESDFSEEENMELNKTQTYNILFIGNSYTYYSDMPEKIFRPIAKSAGYKFNVKSITKGGWYLIDSANPEDEVGKLVEAELNTTKYDFVILQEQSTCPILNAGKFYDGVRRLVAKIKENGATPILYGTWGRKTGSETLTNRGWTHESMTWALSAGYEAIANELGIEVAHVGLAFHDVYTNNGSVTDIYFEDLTHPSYSGSYLAAMTIFAKISGIDPRDIAFNGTLSSEITSVLKEAAQKAVFETPDIPGEYKTDSKDIHVKD